MLWEMLGILFIVCAVLCAVGFYKFVYFLSIGYGFAIAGGGIASFIMYLLHPTATPALVVALQAALFVIYGARLSGFLLIRELKSVSFRKTALAHDIFAKNSEKKMPVFVLAAIWITVTVLYVAQVSPMLFRFANGSEDFILPIVGLAVSVLGVVIEAVADNQKSAQKKERPHMVATKGLYKIVRCPNYFGEIVFWTGVLIGGVTAYANVWQCVVALVAYISIVYIMFLSAQRLEKRQSALYGSNSEYTDYTSKTPIIIPLIPIYHLNKKQ